MKIKTIEERATPNEAEISFIGALNGGKGIE
jgi:hypothetical protein